MTESVPLFRRGQVIVIRSGDDLDQELDSFEPYSSFFAEITDDLRKAGFLLVFNHLRRVQFLAID